MEEERPLLRSVDLPGEVVVCGEYGSEEAQEGEGESGRHQGRSRRVRGGSEVLDPIRGGGGGEPLKLHPDIFWGRRLGRIRTERTRGAPTAAGAAEG